MKLKDAYSLEKSYDQPRQHINKQRNYFANKSPSSQGYGFSSGYVWMWELNYEESWALKNWCFRFLFFYFFKNINLFWLEVNYFTILYWFCHTSTWIHHRYTRVPHPEPPSLLPPCTIPLGRLSAPAPSIRYPASDLDWQFVSYMGLYMFQCHSPKSSHPLPLPQSPKYCSIHLCLFCCLAYRVIVTIFLNSIYMR